MFIPPPTPVDPIPILAPKRQLYLNSFPLNSNSKNHFKKCTYEGITTLPNGLQSESLNFYFFKLVNRQFQGAKIEKRFVRYTGRQLLMPPKDRHTEIRISQLFCASLVLMSAWLAEKIQRQCFFVCFFESAFNSEFNH